MSRNMFAIDGPLIRETMSESVTMVVMYGFVSLLWFMSNRAGHPNPILCASMNEQVIPRTIYICMVQHMQLNITRTTYQ